MNTETTEPTRDEGRARGPEHSERAGRAERAERAEARTFNVEVLAPIHAGDGRDLVRGIDWAEDPSGVTHVLDVPKALATLGADVAEPLRVASQPDLVGLLSRRHVSPRAVAAYLVRGLPPAGTALVRAQSRSGGRPVIPGSTLRGALRTALHWGVTHAIDPVQKKWVLTAEARGAMDDVLGADARGAGQALERPALGPGSRRDAMRPVRVSDIVFDATDLGFFEARVLTLSQGGGADGKPRARWKARGDGPGAGGGGGRNRAPGLAVDRPDDRGALSLVVEAVRAEARSKVRLAVPPALWKTLRQAAFDRAVLESAREYRFYAGAGVTPVAEHYAALNKRIVADANSQALYLRLGWGAGWEAQTGFNSDDYLRGRVRERFDLGRSNAESFPKTRHVVYKDGRVSAPWGWLRLEPEVTPTRAGSA